MNKIGAYFPYAIFFILLSCSPQKNESNQWTRFRGTDGMGRDTIESAPEIWESSDFRWTISLPGIGNGSPVVWENRIFVTSADDEKDIGYVIALNAEEGDILWQKEITVTDLSMHRENNLASPSPAVDRSHVYVIWYSKEKTKLVAFRHNGSLQWQAEFGGIESRHGGGSSLMLTDKYVVFTREQEEGSSLNSSWVAVDKQSGKTAWELERNSAEANSFSTPILINRDGLEIQTDEDVSQNAGLTDQLVFASQAHGLTGVNPETGEILWERSDLFPARVVASPLYADGLIIACRKGEALAIELDQESSEAADSVRYSLPPNLSPYVPTPIALNGLLFLFTDNGSVACVKTSTGELLWKERPAGPIYGSPICVDGILYCITKAGKVLAIQANSVYKLLGIMELGEGSFSTPAMCNSGIVFRTFTALKLH